ncbi:phage protein, HK97 gp10 family [Clostridium sp. USBA 49]|uniref:HK97-gp10 family putative phage morphogenesis protein n=1 Tax=Clostridium sp. USBA 49 TaxID=1881060 RepID=UPI000998FC9B|nr:HK97-gp10 family putative phage morphogenesis protein [Clostridium sp. USBA 49]SKA75194.1 phage protein, HK97 gp10 family [Clostridium sp. USBA 49]
MDVNDELIRNLEKLAENFIDNLAEEFEEMRDDMQEEAEDRVPVDTGNLKNSIDFKVTRDADEIGINLNTDKLEDYWDCVEFGTSKQRPQPYLRPAIEKGMEELQDRLQKAFIKSVK